MQVICILFTKRQYMESLEKPQVVTTEFAVDLGIGLGWGK